MTTANPSGASHRYSKVGDTRVNTDGSVSTLVDAGDGVIGTLTSNCPPLGPLFLHKRTGVISATPEAECAA